MVWVRDGTRFLEIPGSLPPEHSRQTGEAVILSDCVLRTRTSFRSGTTARARLDGAQGSVGFGDWQMKRIYVGNLPFSATEDEVRALFGQHGTVNAVNLISDRETGRPRGFGFVEMEEDGADAAISALNGTMMGGRSLKVNEARPRESRPRGGGGFGGGGGW
jgi:hypothetical protein